MSLGALATAALRPDTAFLGVGRSVTGRRWRERTGDPFLGLALAQRLELPELVGRLMAARGVALDAAERHLSPTLRDWLPDPSSLKDMDRAVARLVRAVREGERVAIFADYDVDGAASSALLRRYLEALGVPTRVYVPDRIAEGYGPNLAALKLLQAEGAGVAVLVDCGTVAHDVLRQASSAGLDILVIDHHAAEPVLPPAVAVVNPNRLDDESGVGHLCAAGVTFLVLVALNRALRQAGFPAGRGEQDLLQLLDLVALATVCDVVPLRGLNRAFVAQGVKVMAQRRRPGLVALGDGAGLSERLDAYHLGFVLGPRINAGGRVGQSDLGTRLLAADDPHEARRLAAELEQHNSARREIEAQALAAAIDQVEATAEVSPLVLAHGAGWHPGVIGIVAARLVERYRRPALVVAWEGEAGKGSGRSVPGFDLGAAVIAARQAGLLIGGGGHPMAAGFVVDRGRIGEFAAFLASRIGLGADDAVAAELGIDGALQIGACTPELCTTIERLGPFGNGNAEPRFVLPHVRVVKAEAVGAGHVRCLITAPGGTGRMKAIAFRTLETPLGKALIGCGGAALHLAGHLRADSWQGRREVQLVIEDAALPYG